MQLGLATDQTVKDALDVKKNHVAVGWIGSDAFGKTLMMRAVVHDPSPELFAVDLPGVRHSPQEGMLIELFLARTSNARSTSVYASTPEKRSSARRASRVHSGNCGSTVSDICDYLARAERTAVGDPADNAHRNGQACWAAVSARIRHTSRGGARPVVRYGLV